MARVSRRFVFRVYHASQPQVHDNVEILEETEMVKGWKLGDAKTLSKGFAKADVYPSPRL
jgi:hypothetical protein